MANFSVPIATGVFPQPPDIANARGTDLSWLGNIPDSYWAGVNQRNIQEQRDVFKNGIPPNAGELLNALARVQGAGAAPAIMQYYKMLYGQQADQEVSPSNIGAQPSPPIAQGPPSSAGGAVRSTPAVVGDKEAVERGLYDAPTAPGQRPPIQQEASSAQPVPLGQRFGQFQPPGAPPSGAVAGATVPVQGNTAQTIATPASSDPTLGGLVPVGRTPPQQIDLLSHKISSGMLEPAQEKDYQARIDAINQAMGQYRQGAIRNAELPPEVKTAREAGFTNPLDYEQAKAQTAADVTHFGNVRNAIDAASNAATRIEHYTQLSRGVLKDPNAYFGTGEGLNLAFKKIRNAINPSDTTSLPQEAYRKVVASSVLAQTENLKDAMADLGPSGGRIFQAQIELMQQAAGNPDNSANALRLLTEVADRGAKFSHQVAAMARSYKGGHLDAGFMQKLDNYTASHPMFSEKEMNDLRLVAPPEAPAFHTVDDAKAWEQRMGVNPGDPIRLPSGRTVPAP